MGSGIEKMESGAINWPPRSS